jgi:hypothetical protein
VPRPVLLVVCALAVVGGACGGGGSTHAEATTTTRPATTTTLAKGHWGSPQEAANNLMLAWKNSDGEAAAKSAKQDAVLFLFAKTYVQYQQRGCDAPSQLGSDCNYRLAAAGGLRLHVVADPVAGYLVESVTPID